MTGHDHRNLRSRSPEYAVKLTIALTAALEVDLERYAALHAQTYGEPVDAVTLIPHMLESFIMRDRGFKALKAKVSGSRFVEVG